MKLEDLASVAEHECQHARQDIAVGSDPNSNWRKLDDYFNDTNFNRGGTAAYAMFNEADAYGIELGTQGSWRYINTRFGLFRNTNYTPANNLRVVATNAVVKQAMREILQDVYKRARIAFPEMQHRKIHPYDWEIRPPENPKQSAAPQIFISP